MAQDIRVRFAPSPTGFMHLGNIRAALINYIFAKQKDGTFVLRIEDTDVDRNISEAGLKIVEDLKWLNIFYDEGPSLGGDYGPYIQSERIELYQKNLDDLVSNQKVYRCFCTVEELEEKRKMQVQKGLPPRYDRTCLHLSDDKIKMKLDAGKPFIWRFKVNEDQVFKINSMARDSILFEMKNFSDFPLTRSDGSFTFLFANFVDDLLMKITHVIRGEDHLSNTAMQAALFDSMAVNMPTFWHLPIICNKEGKKLSKRDFGFVLKDLVNEGFLPEAICNYLAIIGGSFKEEIQSLDELAHNFDFNNVSSSGAIKYDVEKLKWINHKWIERTPSEKLLPLVVDFITREIEVSKDVEEDKMLFLIEKVKCECRTIKDFSDNLRFYFIEPEVDIDKIDEFVGKNKTTTIASMIDESIKYIDQRDLFIDKIKRDSGANKIKLKESFGTIRYLLTGKFQGIGMHDLLEMLDEDTIASRLKKI